LRAGAREGEGRRKPAGREERGYLGVDMLVSHEPTREVGAWREKEGERA
jgi:hypothetical protein